MKTFNEFLKEEIILPIKINSIIMKSFKGRKSNNFPGFFIIEDEKTNEWLTNQFGLNTDDNENSIQPYTFNFDWKIQQWVVK